VIRKGENLNLSVKIGEMKSAELAQNGDATSDKGRLGVAVRPLDKDESGNGATGLVVERSTGAAARAGIQPGDIILALNGTPVKNGEQFRSLVQGAGHRVALLIQREDAKIFIPVELG